MTQQFLTGLPKVPLGELPRDSTCMICLNAYGNGSLDNGGIAEGPIRLPCEPHLGSDLQRARAIVAKVWQSQPQSAAETNDQNRTEATEVEIADLAHSFQALQSLEMVFHIGRISEGPRGRFPTLTDPITELGREQEEALSLELGRQGAFARHCDRPACAGLTNRERWRLHRDRDSEVWNRQAGVWDGFGAD
ncbi:hypothetical protein HO133_000704 [Letharia lupina]|uniref:Uncharacterized protein n=1 Tax=Letharia lupina TaxID=560253 RepID=A0A8H6CFR6_9LECA|nr:uncharacterized protein HO133_000704 [Letharia lupina]KAF6222657.1 hypothetical protein HO133_000704 [Letharia lupina]